VPMMIEELLRYVSPAQWIPRIAFEDIELHGTRVRAGQTVMGIAAAANRDPSFFDDPDALDLTREGPPHVGLGFGPKFCLGASVIRMEARCLLEGLAERFPDIRLDMDPEDVDWSGANPMIRGVRTVPIRLGPQARPRTATK
jgi:biflaviolin synthase